MKNKLLNHYFMLVVALQSLFTLTCLAQAPFAISYQAIARNNAGNPIVNQPISLRFSIHNSSGGGSIVYQETQNVSTNANGLFNLNIGQGSNVTGSFGTINWGGGSKYIQVEMDTAGGNTYTDMGTQQILSVPYALFAGNAGESNTASNLGTGIGIFSSKAGVDLQFKSLKAAGNKILVNSTGNDILIDVNESNLALQNLGGLLTVPQGGTGLANLTAGNFLVGNGTGVINTTKVAPAGIVVGNSDAQILTNKTITSNTNSVRASELGTTGSSVVVGGAAAPSTGQVLTATSSTTAAWQTSTAMSGFETVTASATLPAGTSATKYRLSVACPAGKKAIGGGFRLSQGTLNCGITPIESSMFLPASTPLVNMTPVVPGAGLGWNVVVEMRSQTCGFTLTVDCACAIAP